MKTTHWVGLCSTLAAAAAAFLAPATGHAADTGADGNGIRCFGGRDRHSHAAQREIAGRAGLDLGTERRFAGRARRLRPGHPAAGLPRAQPQH